MRSDYDTERWRELSAAVKRRDGWRCTKCGTRARLDAHHIQPVGLGGPMWDPENLETLCRNCHMAQHPGWGELGDPVAHRPGDSSGIEAERSPAVPAAAPKRGAWATIGAIAGGGLGCVIGAGLGLAFLAVDILGTWLVAEWLQSHRWPSVAAWIVGFLIATTVISTVLYLAFTLLAGAGLALAGALKWLWRHPLVVVAFLAGALLAAFWLVPPQYLPWNRATASRSAPVAPVPTETASPVSMLSVPEYAARCATWDWRRSEPFPETYTRLASLFADTLADMRMAIPPSELVEMHNAATAKMAALRDAADRRDAGAVSRIATDAEAPENAEIISAYENIAVGAMRELVAAGCIAAAS